MLFYVNMPSNKFDICDLILSIYLDGFVSYGRENY